MLSKCVNPDCSDTFRYLHEGRIFYLAPTRDVQRAVGMSHPGLHERFWLCTRCAQEMTVALGRFQGESGAPGRPGATRAGCAERWERRKKMACARRMCWPRRCLKLNAVRQVL